MSAIESIEDRRKKVKFRRQNSDMSLKRVVKPKGPKMDRLSHSVRWVHLFILIIAYCFCLGAVHYLRGVELPLTDDNPISIRFFLCVSLALVGAISSLIWSMKYCRLFRRRLSDVLIAFAAFPLLIWALFLLFHVI